MTTAIGFGWMAFLHWDIQRYKKFALKCLKPRKKGDKSPSPETPSSEDIHSAKILDQLAADPENGDNISISTAYIFNHYQKPREDDNTTITGTLFKPKYRFLKGKHSGNFYLKVGMTGTQYALILRSKI